MRRSSTGSRIRVVLLIALSSLILPAAGCIEGTCEDNCLDQYDDCLARSPPGASKADCGDAYDSCLQSCSSVGDAPEQN